MASRYGITSSDLSQNALNLQIGSGISDRVKSTDSDDFIQRAEDWVESQVEEFLGVPLQPVRAPGQAKANFDASNPTRRNFPHDFVEAAIYRALGLLLTSEYFENDKNASAAGEFSLQLAWSHIDSFKDRRTFRVGSGRVRHPNPHMPPSIAPRQERNNPPGMLQ